MNILRVEVVYALPDRQALRCVSLREGSTVEDALLASGLLAEFPEISSLRTGVFGKPAARSTLLRDRDRVEVYRFLKADPKEARRARAGARRQRK